VYVKRRNELAGRLVKERIEVEAPQTKSATSAKATAPSKPKFKSAKVCYLAEFLSCF